MRYGGRTDVRTYVHTIKLFHYAHTSVGLAQARPWKFWGGGRGGGGIPAPPPPLYENLERQPQTYLENALVTEQQVGGLEVAMQDPVVVEMVHRTQQL